MVTNDLYYIGHYGYETFLKFSLAPNAFKIVYCTRVILDFVHTSKICQNSIFRDVWLFQQPNLNSYERQE